LRGLKAWLAGHCRAYQFVCGSCPAPAHCCCLATAAQAMNTHPWTCSRRALSHTSARACVGACCAALPATGSSRVSSRPPHPRHDPRCCLARPRGCERRAGRAQWPPRAPLGQTQPAPQHPRCSPPPPPAQCVAAVGVAVPSCCGVTRENTPRDACRHPRTTKLKCQRDTRLTPHSSLLTPV
jgi:hypothetical protein